MAAQICETCRHKNKGYCTPNSTCGAYAREFGETKKEKITQIIYDYLDYVYCNTCRYNSELETDKYGDDPCEDCIRKSMGWEISVSAAEQIAEDILKLEE
jgi:hypothetical protein